MYCNLSEVELDIEYNEYLMKCREEGIIKPRTKLEFKWWGVIFPKVTKTGLKEPKVETKADIARRIFAEELEKGLVRKIVVARFVSEAELTIAGAGTYYANYMIKLKKQREDSNG